MTTLREVMDQKSLTIADVAAATGLDPKTVWHATQGRKITRATKIAIAGAVNVPESELFMVQNIQNAISKEPSV